PGQATGQCAPFRGEQAARTCRAVGATMQTWLTLGCAALNMEVGPENAKDPKASVPGALPVLERPSLHSTEHCCAAERFRPRHLTSEVAHFRNRRRRKRGRSATPSL